MKAKVDIVTGFLDSRTFLNQFSTGSVMGFLVLEPMIDVKNMLVLLSSFRNGFVIKLVAIIFGFSFVLLYFLTSFRGDPALCTPKDCSLFVEWIQEIYEHMDKYKGKKIQVVGFVFKDEQFKKNEFVPARMMMVCCAADMQPIGLLCSYAKASELKKDVWVKVSGRIGQGEFEGQKMPMIEVESVEPANKPKNEFVYPY